ncbi:MAG: hypothetical protein IT460_14925 [Planctomycetes bacterium]|nr:hypothetical protein [Planctomycetota bacterium]
MADGLGRWVGRMAASAATYFVLAVAATAASLVSVGSLNVHGPSALGADLAFGVCCALIAAGLWVAAAVVAARPRA